MRIAALGTLSVLISGTPYAPQRSPRDAQVLQHYPPAAFEAGINGEAVLRCERTEHAAFVDCIVLSDYPKDQGFGAAALRLAAQAADCQTMVLPAAERRQHEYVFGFRATATLPLIWPEVSSVERSATYLVRTASQAEVAAVYPPKAKQAHISGRAVMLCTATPKGNMAACFLEDEEPKGYGFGDAAMQTGYLFKAAPQSPSQCPFAPTEVAIPFAWRSD